MELEEYRRTALENWQAMASGWERRREEIERVTQPVGEWMLLALDPQPSDTVLELAAGPGGTGFAAAAILGEQGRLISSDFSPDMVEVARRRAAELDLVNVEHRVIDAEEIPLDENSVDGVLCRFGFMLMADPEAALAETRRVLRQGGHLALAVWSTAADNPWISISGRILSERGLAPQPEPGAPGMFVLADEARLRGLLEGAGFSVERVEKVPVLFEFDDADDYIVRSNDTGGMFSRIWRDASDADRAAIAACLAEDFAPFAVGSGFELPGVAVVVAAS